jgi:hypothetical protein
MIPVLNILTTQLEDATHPSRTYKAVELDSESDSHDLYRTRIKGYADSLESLEQAIYLILGTERYKFPIYSWDYGVELNDLFGKPIPYVMSELPRRIKEALMVDDRISDVKDFEFEKTKNQLHVTFSVISDYGELTSELEVVV